jgi:Fe2+ or Zn2+ uptake regulation protein
MKAAEWRTFEAVLGRHGDARYGPADRPHHHAVRVVCGRVAEIPEDVMCRLVDAAGLTLTGRCQDCA